VTIGCRAHEDPPCGSEGERSLAFLPRPADPDAPVFAPSETAWMNLEFLAYYVNYSDAVALIPFAKPPWLNDPGRMMTFELRGFRGEGGIEPNELAARIVGLIHELCEESKGDERVGGRGQIAASLHSSWRTRPGNRPRQSPMQRPLL